MAAMILAKKSFVHDLDVWLRDIRDEETPQSIEETREHFREIMRRQDATEIAEAVVFVKLKADDVRGRNDRAKGITERIKANIRREKAAAQQDATTPQGESK